ncbi:PAS domain-containing protein [Hyphococcus formosus]|uniref:PAS domain-containing protein n=1 Tax=Hyphococcus formosus TaxID=3143534 RepID=UPI00398A9628
MIAELQSAVSQVSSRKARLRGLTQVESVKIKVERAALLFRGAPVAIFASIANALIIFLIARSYVEQTILLGWVGAVMGVALLRAGLWLKFKISGVSARNLSRFARLHLSFMVLNGALWGALGPIFSVSGAIEHAILPFIIAGMTAAAIVSAGASWRAVLAFNLPALLPLAAAYAITLGTAGLGIAAIIGIYTLATSYLALTTQRMIDRSILLHTKNEKLLSVLRRRVDDAHTAEQRFRALVEASQDITLIFSPEGKLVYASPSAEKAFNTPSGVLVGKTTKEIVHPDDMSQFRSVGEKSLSQLGEVIGLPHVCMRGAQEGEYVAMTGRLTNMLYVPGVEGFVFSGSRLRENRHTHHVHAAE